MRSQDQVLHRPPSTPASIKATRRLLGKVPAEDPYCAIEFEAGGSMNDGSGPAANLLAHGPNRDLRPAAEPQLAQDCLDVTLDRPLDDL